MERFQMENIYEANDILNYQLRNADDLLKCHGIAYENIQGYEYLTEENKEIFKRFLFSFLNSHGLVKRFNLIPTAINLVEDIEYIANDPDDEECILTAKRIIKALCKNGKKKIIHRYESKEYKGLDVINNHSEIYLRFEYKEGKEKTWLHVTHQGTQWY